MKIDNLANEKLIALFASSSEQQYNMIIDDDIKKYNLLVEKQDEL